jgi:ABC-type sugar transport system ATPase subunit
MEIPLIELKEIEKSFSGVCVLHDIGFKLYAGQVMAVCGENGAGKSTLLNIIGGIYKQDRGKMWIKGVPYNPQGPQNASKAGIGFIHQELSLFTNLSVMENIFVDDLPLNNPFCINKKIMMAKSRELMHDIGLDINMHTKIGNLPMGRRQMVEIARILARNVEIVVFDEPTTSLSNNEKERLFLLIKKFKQEQKGILFVSHVLEDVFRLCDTIMVIRDGSLIGIQQTKGTSQEEIIKMMVGRDMKDIYPPYKKKTSGPELLRAVHYKQGEKLKEVSLSIHAGEIVGLYGLMGAGRSEMAAALYGITEPDSGELYIDGVSVGKVNPQICKRYGIAYLTENRREEGLLMPKSVRENLVLGILSKLRMRFGVINKDAEKKNAVAMQEQLRIKTFDMDTQAAMNLSGGNQQKVVLGKWLLTKPRVLILDEPTKGIDVGAKYEIYTYIAALAEESSGILMISSEMEELMGICDRILVMAVGRITGELQRDQYSQEKLLRLSIEGYSNE